MMPFEESCDFEWDNFGMPWRDSACSSSFAGLHLILDEQNADLGEMARTLTEMEYESIVLGKHWDDSISSILLDLNER